MAIILKKIKELIASFIFRISMSELVVFTFILTVVLIWALKPLADRIGLIDIPTKRKIHTVPALLIGGLAMVIAAKIIFLLFFPEPIPSRFWYLLLGLSIIMLCGLLDDLYHLSHRKLFSLQIAAALLVVLVGEAKLDNLGALLGSEELSLGLMAILFSVISIIGLINAYNMADGVDGLAGSLTLVTMIWFAILATLLQRHMVLALILIIIGAIIGFMLFNLRSPWLKRAHIFMGNVGSMSLGFLVAWIAIRLVNFPGSSLYPITMVYIVGLPLLDMARVMILRVIHGRSPFKADRLHIHYQLLSAGFSVNQTVLIKASLTAMLGAAGFAGWYFGVPEYMMFYAYILIFAVYIYFAQHVLKK